MLEGRRGCETGLTDAPRAVVVGLDCMTGLQTARTLARHGVPVIGLAGNRRHYACRTRVCEQILTADVKGDGFIVELERLGPSLGQRAVLFPCTDLSVLLISLHRKRLESWYHVLLPGHDVVVQMMDKLSFLIYAQANGLAVPVTMVIEKRADAELAAESLVFPCVIKPPIKSAGWQARTSAKVFQVSDPDHLLEVYDRVAGWADVLIAQEWVEGGEDQLFSCNGYFDAASRPLVTFVARKLRQWPPHTGTSCLGEECHNDVVLAETVRLFHGVGFHGLAYLEMKRDVRTGRHFIIEPNVGRPTGRSAIAEGGGVELLYAAYCDAVGLPLPENIVQRYIGTKWIDIRRDMQSALYFMRRGELTPRRWAKSLSGPLTHAVLSRRDPLPFLVDLLHSLRKAADQSVARLRAALGGAQGSNSQPT